MGSTVRLVFLLLACLLANSLESRAQTGAGAVAEESHPPGPFGADADADKTAETLYISNASRSPDRASYSNTVASFLGAAITKPSPGRFTYVKQEAWQSNGTGWGESAEYRMRIRGGNFGGILFSETPTNGTLYVPGQKPFSWPIRRYEFDVLWTHEFSCAHELLCAHGRAVPYVTSGAGAIALDGGPAESGWDKQAALVAGAGSDVRLTRFVTLRAGFTLDSFKASTYSDRRYRASDTVMVEPRIGLVWGLGMPHPR